MRDLFLGTQLPGIEAAAIGALLPFVGHVILFTSNADSRQTRSTTIAMPWPTPMHMVHRA